MKELKNFLLHFKNDKNKLNELKQILKFAKEDKLNFNSLIFNLQDELEDDEEGYFLKKEDLFIFNLHKEEINNFLTS